MTSDYLKETALKAMTEGGSYDEGVIVLMRWAGRNKKLSQAIMKRYLPEACRDLLRTAVRGQRKVTWDRVAKAELDRIKEQASVPEAPMGEGLAAVAQRLTLYDFRLYNGKRLGDATVEDIESSIKQYLAQATDMAAKAAWLQLVVDRMHRCDAVADTTVQMIIDADTLANLAKRSL